jgi:hypothetical protein
MTREDREWIWDVVTWAVMTIVVACGGDGANARFHCRIDKPQYVGDGEEEQMPPTNATTPMTYSFGGLYCGICKKTLNKPGDECPHMRHE